MSLIRSNTAKWIEYENRRKQILQELEELRIEYDELYDLQERLEEDGIDKNYLRICNDVL